MTTFKVKWTCMTFAEPSVEGAIAAANEVVEWINANTPGTTVLSVYNPVTLTEYVYDTTKQNGSLHSKRSNVSESDFVPKFDTSPFDYDSQIVTWTDIIVADTPVEAAIEARRRLLHQARNRGFFLDVWVSWNQNPVGVYLMTKEEIEQEASREQ